MPKKPVNLNLKTERMFYNRSENNKLTRHLREKQISEEFHDNTKTDISWEVEQLAKSLGIYLEFDRAKTGREQDWMYMVRVSNPGGGPINRKQWRLIDELSEKYTTSPHDGHPSARLTTRQNIQFHWLNKQGTMDLIKILAENDLRSINGCGDNTRNVMGCPLSRGSKIFDAWAWAQKAGAYFQLPLEPFIKVFAIDPNFIRKPEESFSYGQAMLNRKFKIAFGAVHEDPKTGKLYPDNCIEALTNDACVIPLIENNAVKRFQVYVGGGQGERNGKPSLAALGKPIAVISEEQIMPALDAVVKVHQEWGDRENRHWARVKFVVKVQGPEWYRQRMQELLDFPLQDPVPDYDYGSRHLHFGWIPQADKKWTYGMYLENGRVTDAGPNGKLKTMLRHLMDTYDTEMMITANQDALFTNIPDARKAAFEADLKQFGYGERNGKPYSTLRTLSGACVGRDTCRLTYTDSEKFEPELLDQLEALGWGDMNESIGITGCERQCFRPSTKTIGLIGSGLNRYQVRLFGDETAKFQGMPLIEGTGEKMFLRSVPRDQVAAVIDVLFKFYKAGAQNGESMGAFHRRLGPDAIIAHLKENPVTSPLMEKPFPADCVVE